MWIFAPLIILLWKWQIGWHSWCYLWWSRPCPRTLQDQAMTTRPVSCSVKPGDIWPLYARSRGSAHWLLWLAVLLRWEDPALPGHLSHDLVPVPPQALPHVLLLGVHVTLRGSASTVLPGLWTSCGGGRGSWLDRQHSWGKRMSSVVLNSVTILTLGARKAPSHDEHQELSRKNRNLQTSRVLISNWLYSSYRCHFSVQRNICRTVNVLCDVVFLLQILKRID